MARLATLPRTPAGPVRRSTYDSPRRSSADGVPLAERFSTSLSPITAASHGVSTPEGRPLHSKDGDTRRPLPSFKRTVTTSATEDADDEDFEMLPHDPATHQPVAKTKAATGSPSSQGSSIGPVRDSAWGKEGKNWVWAVDAEEDGEPDDHVDVGTDHDDEVGAPRRSKRVRVGRYSQ